MKNIFGKKASVQQSSRFIAETELTYVRSEHLSLGMYIAKLDCPWLDSPFKLQGFNITTERELQVVRSRCHHVYVDRTRQSKLSLDAKTTAVGKAVVIGTARKKKGSFETEIARATTTYLDTGRLVADFMQTVKDGGSIDSKQAKEAVASSVNSILHSPDAHLWLTQLKKKDEYTAQHSLNVCMLSIVLGRHIGLPEGELRNLGICGMMHDMGIMLIPSAIVNKTSELTEEESVIMKTHTTLGAELLKSSKDMFHGAIETALTHHERIRGQGYPRGLTDAKVSYYSNIIAIVDTYDALTSDRSYRKGMTHLEATQVLYQQAGEYFDHVLVSKFIESLGVFPPGCYVQLSDDRVALVLEANDESKLRPRVLTVVDKQMNSIEEVSVDLDTVLLDARGQPLQIQSIVNPDMFNIDRLKHFNESAIGRGLAMAAA
ncbi:MAG: HD-GYP domain-containing protein [Cycloclasticus sp.]